MPGIATQILREIQPDGRAVMEVAETGTRYTALLCMVPGGGNNLVALPDPSGAPLSGGTTVDEQVEASKAGERETEELRQRKLAEARGETRGLAADEVPPTPAPTPELHGPEGEAALALQREREAEAQAEAQRQAQVAGAGQPQG